MNTLSPQTLSVCALLALFAVPAAAQPITFLNEWGSSGSADGQLNGPRKAGADSAGNVYVADRFNNRLQKFDTSGTYVTDQANDRIQKFRDEAVRLFADGFESGDTAAWSSVVP